MTQQDPRNFTFSSDYPMAYFVFDKVVQVTVPASSGSIVETTLTVPHGLDFAPMPVGFWSNDANFKTTNDIGTELYGGNYKEVLVVADETNYYVIARKVQNAALTFYVHLWGYMPPDANGHAPAVTDTTNYYFNTDYPYLEIYKSGITTSGNTTIYHSLGYVPYCKIWGKGTLWGHKGIFPYFQTYWTDSTSGGTIDKEKLVVGSPDKYYHIYTAEVKQP